MFKNIRTLILFVSLFFIFFVSLFFSSCQGRVQNVSIQCASDEYFDHDLQECVRDQNSSIRSPSRSSNRRGNDLRSVSSDIRFRRLRQSDFDGQNCSRFEECSEKCERISRRNSFVQECEDLPEDMVEVLYESYQDLEIFNFGISEDFNVLALGTLMWIDKRVLIDLAEEWSELNAAGFLSYIASNRVAIEVLKEEDSNNEFFREVLRTFNQESDDVFKALLKSLERYRETFVSQAVEADNKEAVIRAFSLISNKNDFICQRTEVERSRSSVYNSRGGDCHYLSSDSRQLSRAKHCYILGPSVWSYLNNIDEITFTGYLSQHPLNEDSCEVWCSGHSRCEYED